MSVTFHAMFIAPEVLMALLHFPPHSNIRLEKLFQRCHNAMKIGVVQKVAIVNGFVLHTGADLGFSRGADFQKISKILSTLFFLGRPD